MPQTAPGQISAIVCLLVCGFALVRGRLPERVAAGAFLVGLVGDTLLQDRRVWSDSTDSLLGVDGMLLVVLSSLVTNTRRRWVLFATAFQLVATLTHFVTARSLEVRPWAYLTVLAALNYGLLACLAGGTWDVSRNPQIRVAD